MRIFWQTITINAYQEELSLRLLTAVNSDFSDAIGDYSLGKINDDKYSTPIRACLRGFLQKKLLYCAFIYLSRV